MGDSRAARALRSIGVAVGLGFESSQRLPEAFFYHMAGGNRSRSVGISILYARPGGSSHLAGLIGPATRQPKTLLSCDKIKVRADGQRLSWLRCIGSCIEGWNGVV